MPEGWRKIFGIQMCKEIKRALLEDGRKKLYKYRITQIKEKFGSLRWYDSCGNEETDGLINIGTVGKLMIIIENIGLKHMRGIMNQ